MSYRKVFSTLVFGLLFFAGCIPDKEITVQLPPYQRKLAVEAYLEPGKPYRALVSETIAYFDPIGNPGLEGASVVITTSGRDDTLVFSPYLDVQTRKYFNYRTENIFYPEVGREYTIKATDRQGRTLAGTAVCMPTPVIDTVIIRPNDNGEASAVVHIADDPGARNYYRVIINRNDPNVAPDHDNLTDDRLVNSLDEVVVTTGAVWKPGDRLYVRVYQLEENYYNFLQSIREAQAASQNPFAQPVVIRSTVQGGFGVFAVHSLSEKQVLVP